MRSISRIRSRRPQKLSTRISLQRNSQNTFQKIRNISLFPTQVIAHEKSLPDQTFQQFFSSSAVQENESESDVKGNIIPFMLADIGEGIAEVEILDWKVQEGDTVREFDPICEVQSDKANVEITSRFTGTIHKIHHDVGQLARVGHPLLDIVVENGDMIADHAPTEQPEPQASSEPEIIQEDSQSVKDDSPVDKVTIPYTEGRLLRSESRNITGEKVLTTPAVRKLAKEHEINLQEILGTGKDGRITKGDVLDVIQGKAVALSSQTVKSNEASPVVSPTTTPVPAYVESFELTEDRVVPVSGIQRLMVKTMEKANEVPHFGYCDEYDLTQTAELRASMNAAFADRGVKLSYLPIILKATSLALKEYPSLNAHFDSENMQVIERSSHNIGLAMDTPRGLLVPVIKDVQQMSLMDISLKLSELQAKGIDNKLGEEDLSGGTFTLSNIGAIGGTYASPLLVVPQVAIGALGKLQDVPRFDKEGNVMKAKVMNVSWSADHRVVDGATMARFSNKLRDFLEDPTLMTAFMK